MSLLPLFFSKCTIFCCWNFYFNELTPSFMSNPLVGISNAKLSFFLHIYPPHLVLHNNLLGHCIDENVFVVIFSKVVLKLKLFKFLSLIAA